MSPNRGILKCKASGNFSCTYPVPANADKPAPNRLNAKPVAYWLVPSQITNQPNTPANAAPTTMPAPKPARVLPVCTTVAKPAKAAHNIMPSAPKFKMPAFSLINRPSDANANMVPASNAAAISNALLTVISSKQGDWQSECHTPIARTATALGTHQ